MKQSFITILTVALALHSAPSGAALPQAVTDSPEIVRTDSIPADSAAYTVRSIEEIDMYLDSLASVGEVIDVPLLPRIFFMPAIYDSYRIPFEPDVTSAPFSGQPEMRWVEEQAVNSRKMQLLKYNLFFNHPEIVRYNESLLPEAPKKYRAVVNPEEHTIQILEIATTDSSAPTLEGSFVKPRHWIRTFSASIQFSQAFVSPNWYQGGNNNLNMLGNIYYNVKLNNEYHKRLLFETTFQYKLGMNNAPDDEVHNYSISDDLFQINTTFGLKAARRWYYSFTGQFKTQLLHSYPSNSEILKAAFLSPGELTAGIGMTYNYVNGPKTVTFDASIAPLSYNIRTCINSNVDPTTYSIKAGHTFRQNFGSSCELKLTWKIAYNIVYSGRFFAFTDYTSAQMDWENKVNFDINRFLTTQIYVHARYDTQTPQGADKSWKKLQLKEILSFGFAYKFSSL